MQPDLGLFPKPPVVLGPLDGPDGNAFSILGAASRAWRAAGRDRAEFEAIAKDAMSGDYEHLLDVIEHHFTVVGTAVVAVPDWRERAT